MRVVATILSFLLLIAPALSASKPIDEDQSFGIENYMQPNLFKGDNAEYSISCCGPADAYWADDFEIDGDQYVAIITDPRKDDNFRNNNGSPRVHVAPGTRFIIPKERLITFPPQKPNTTGHGWVWLNISEDDVNGEITGITILCYLAPSGG